LKEGDLQHPIGSMGRHGSLVLISTGITAMKTADFPFQIAFLPSFRLGRLCLARFLVASHASCSVLLFAPFRLIEERK